jgi:uncharacterized YkwD family protein/spore coat assembly protein SafA
MEVIAMKKLIIAGVTAGVLLTTSHASAATTYKVQAGDSMWKIAERTETGISELIKANPQIKNPALIYPNQVLTIPTKAYASQTAEVARLVNVERAKQGLKPLTVNWELSRVAQYKAEDMTDKHYFSHTSPTYGDPFTMMKKFGIKYSTAGENIAQGQRSASEVMTAWLNSSGHRANIMNSQYTQIGVGYDSRTNTWVQQFIRP